MSSEQARPAQGGRAIEVANLNKEFRFYDHPTDRLKELLTANQRRYHRIKRALSDISFTVRHGETVGVMGRNGAGKTTLLSVLTGTMAPTSGTVDVYGRVGAILGLGVGFLPQYSGRENLRNGLIALGTAPAELRRKEAEVIEFSELGAEIDNPLRIYSSGMAVRLGFSLAISTDPDILIVDEALGVGDAAFQHKCQREIRRFVENGSTLFFVSHNTALLETTCDRGIVLDGGRVAWDGDIREAVRQMRVRYFGEASVLSQPSSAETWGEPDVALVETQVHDAVRVGDRVFELHQGETLKLRLTVRSPRPIERPLLGVTVRNELGKEVGGLSTIGLQRAVPRIAAGDFTFDVRVPLNMAPGMYTLRVNIGDRTTAPPRLIRVWEEVCAVRVLYAGYDIRGMADPGVEIEYDANVYSLRDESERRHGTRAGDE